MTESKISLFEPNGGTLAGTCASQGAIRRSMSDADSTRPGTSPGENISSDRQAKTIEATSVGRRRKKMTPAVNPRGPYIAFKLNERSRAPHRWASGFRDSW
jgi:hypothetical protein